MKRSKSHSGLFVAAVVSLILGVPASALAQVDAVKGALRKGAQQAQEAAKKPEAQKDAKEGESKSDASKALILFSKSPIDPAKPENLTTAFKAGENIYGLVQVEKTWRHLLGKGDKSATKIEVPFDMLVDGEQVDFQYITIKKPEAIDSQVLVFDIAPDPAKMTAYKDPGFEYAEGKGRRKIGPDTYTYNLGELKPGKHAVRFQIRSYGDIFSAGEFTLEGDDYKPYAALRERILAEAFTVATLPKAQMANKELEATMRKLLENAGWKDIRKLVIVDKDWWLDRAEGGDSPIVSRHLAAAAAAKDEDGKFFWRVCTFHQQKLLDGSFGPLELTDQGTKKPILEENIDK